MSMQKQDTPVKEDQGGSSSNPKKNQKEEDEDEWVCVGHISKFGVRTALRIHERQVTLLRLKSRNGHERWTCLDSVCYHAGGPLMQGNLKQVDNRTCISCPWHSYLVDVFTGEGLYMDMSRKYCSKGVRQRVHQTQIRDNHHVYIRLDNDPNNKIASDDYAYKGRNFANGSLVETHSFPDW